MMQRIKWLSVFIVTALITVATGVSAQEQVIDGRSFYSAYRHYNLINVPERQGRSVSSEFGGEMGGFLSGAARLRWHYADRSLDFKEHELEKTDFSVASHSQTGMIGISLPVMEDRISLDLESGVRRQGRKTDFIFVNRLKLALLEFAVFDMFVGRRTESFDLDGIFWGEEIALSLPTTWISSGFEGKVDLYKDISVMAGYEDYETGQLQVDPYPQFSSNIVGTAGYRYHGLVIGKIDQAYLKAIYGNFRGSGKLSIYTHGTMFGQIPKLKANIERWRIDARFPYMPQNADLTFEYAEGELAAAGHIEGWPFTDPLEDLLGLRRNFKAEAEFKLWHFTTRWKFGLPGRLGLSTVLDLFRVYPDLDFTDWMPSFMVFGVADMDRYHDRYDRIDFGRLYLRATRSFGKFVLGGDVSQLFPIEIKKDSDDVDDSSPASVTATGEKGPRSDGGRNIHLWLAYNF